MAIFYYIERAYLKIKNWLFPPKEDKDRFIY